MGVQMPQGTPDLQARSPAFGTAGHGHGSDTGGHDAAVEEEAARGHEEPGRMNKVHMLNQDRIGIPMCSRQRMGWASSRETRLVTCVRCLRLMGRQA